MISLPRCAGKVPAMIEHPCQGPRAYRGTTPTRALGQQERLLLVLVLLHSYMVDSGSVSTNLLKRVIT